MPEIKKVPSKTVIAVVAVTAAIGVLLWQDFLLEAHLKSSTKITQGLRDELEGLRKENQAFKEKTQHEQTQLESLSAALNNLKQDKSLSGRRQDDLKKLVDDAESSLQGQNLKIKELEKKLQDANEKIRRQQKASASLEQQTRSAKANPAMTAEYVKLVENEWVAATSKTEEMRRDLDKTLGELAGQNKERQKLRADTATMHYNLAVILTEQQNYPAAIREYEKVLEIRPNDADAHYNLAIIYDDYVKDAQKALVHYEQYVKVAPDTPESNRVRQWMREKEYDNAMKFKL